MIVAVDIGGTKTLVAVCHNDGTIITKQKYPSPKNYQAFVKTLTQTIQQNCPNNISIIAIGCAGRLDRQKGEVINSPNLHWQHKPLVKDLSNVFSDIPIIIENDANLAGLSEAHCLDKINQRVMYITFSTGIGTGFVVGGQLEPNLLDSEGGRMVFEHEDQIINWEAFAAGRTIVTKYGKTAAKLNDPAAWRQISKNMAVGIVDNCAVFMPDTVIIGGSVGSYFDKYASLLREEVTKLTRQSAVIKNPKIIGAKNAEDAVMLGCIIIACQYEQHN
jgi:glucokinase